LGLTARAGAPRYSAPARGVAVQGSGLTVEGLGFRVWGRIPKIWGLGFEISSLGLGFLVLVGFREIKEDEVLRFMLMVSDVPPRRSMRRPRPAPPPRAPPPAANLRSRLGSGVQGLGVGFGV